MLRLGFDITINISFHDFKFSSVLEMLELKISPIFYFCSIFDDFLKNPSEVGPHLDLVSQPDFISQSNLVTQT